MQKRLWAVACALFGAVLLALAVAVPARASELPDLPPIGSETYRNGVTVGKVTVGGQTANLVAGTESSGTGWSFDGGHTLTLNGYNGGSILLAGEMTIQLEGQNYLTPTADAAGNSDIVGATNMSHEYVGVFSDNFTVPTYSENPILTITGSGSLTISGTQSNVAYFGIRATVLNIIEGAEVTINLPESTSATAIYTVQNFYGLPNTMYNYAANYDGYGALTVDNATLNINSGVTIQAYDITLNYCTLNVTSSWGYRAVDVAYDQGHLTMTNARGAHQQSFSYDYTFTDPDGKSTNYNVTVKYLVSRTGESDVISLVPGEGVDHAPGWNYENGYYYWYLQDDTYLTDTWIAVDDKYYSFDTDGHLVVDAWVDNSIGLSYYGSDGAAVTSTGWKQIDGSWYYFEKTDSLGWSHAKRNDWLKSGNDYYYFGPDGKPVVNGTADYQGTRYYFDANGKVYKSEKIQSYEGKCGTCSWVIDETGVLRIYPTNGVSGELALNYTDNSSWTLKQFFNWYPYREYITAAVVENGVSGKSLQGMFYGCTKLASVDLSGLDTSQTTDMGYMFFACSALTAADFSKFDTSNVTNMRYMFEGVGIVDLDVSYFDTSKVTDMSLMFADSFAIQTLNVSGWDTSSVTDMQCMFGGAGMETLDISSFDTSNVTNMRWLFDGCKNLRTLIVGDGFVQPTADNTWHAPTGIWEAASDGLTYTGYELAHKRGADTFTRVDTPHEPGWFYDEETDGWYYYMDSGECIKDISWSMGNGTYYFNPDGRLAINQLIHRGGDLYQYAGADGKLVENKWQQVGSYWYHFDNYGYAYANNWLSYGGAYYYFDSQARLVVDSWQKIGTTYYYFGKDGKLATNQWVKYGSSYYYVDSYGQLVRVGWATYNGKYLFLDNYKPLKNTTLIVDGVKYYCDSNGYVTKA